MAPVTEIRLVLTTAITDALGNPLLAEQTLRYTTLDPSSFPAPVISPLPPLYLCATSWTVSGTTEFRALVHISGGASAAGGRVSAHDGTFAFPVSLLAGRLNRLSVVAKDIDRNISSPAVIEIVQDCEPPTVVRAEADSQSDDYVVYFSEPVDPATVEGAVVLYDASGTIPGSAFSRAPSSTTLPAGRWQALGLW